MQIIDEEMQAGRIHLNNIDQDDDEVRWLRALL
jgi:hypothetical protein